MSEHECPHCGSTNTTPVWNEVDDYEAGADPDYIGCGDCEEGMARVGEAR